MMLSEELSVPKIVFFIRAAPRATLDFVLEQCWPKSGILNVVPWRASGDGRWAIYINLKPLGHLGEEAYIPIPWAWEDTPTVMEAVSTFRTMKVNYA